MTEAAHVYVSSWQVGQIVEGTYMVSGSELKSRINGPNYFVLTIADVSGSAEIVFWDDADDLAATGFGAPGTFVNICGKVSEYRGTKNLKPQTINILDDPPSDLSLYVRVSDTSAARAEFKAFHDSIADSDLSLIVGRVFEYGTVWEEFVRAPAGKKHHDAYQGGLLAHTLKVAKNAVALAKNYPDADMDLVVGGALIHDVGKIFEFVFDPTGAAVDHHPWYGMNGHITEGLRLLGAVSEKMASAGEMNEKRRLWFDHLVHLVASHHGKREHGSPCLPLTVEGIILHYADVSECYITAWKEAKDKTIGAAQRSGFSTVFQSSVWIGGTPNSFGVTE